MKFDVRASQLEKHGFGVGKGTGRFAYQFLKALDTCPALAWSIQELHPD